MLRDPFGSSSARLNGMEPFRSRKSLFYFYSLVRALQNEGFYSAFFFLFSRGPCLSVLASAWSGRPKALASVATDMFFPVSK